VILLTAVLAGLMVGLINARWQNKSWQPPEFQHGWLVPVAFMPQLLAFYLPTSRIPMPDLLVAICLVSSQVGLLVFCLLNRHNRWVLLLAAGLALNLVVISANGGFMPLSPEVAARFVPDHILQNIKIGSRLDVTSKDVLLPFDKMVFPWLSDRFLPPTWFPYQFAFSIGDVLISLGAFLLLGTRPGFSENRQKGSSNHVNQSNDQPAIDSSGNTLGLE
jgi:hypothetical protein